MNIGNYRFRQPTVSKAQCPIRPLRQFKVMGRQDRGQSVGPVQPFQHFHHPLRGAMVEVSGWLVRQQNRRSVCQGAGQRHSLLLAPRKLPHTTPSRMRQAHFTQQLSCAELGFREIASSHQLGEHYVFDCAELGQEVVHLPDKPHLSISIGGPTLRSEIIQPLPFEAYLTPRWTVQRHDKVH